MIVVIVGCWMWLISRLPWAESFSRLTAQPPCN